MATLGLVEKVVFTVAMPAEMAILATLDAAEMASTYVEETAEMVGSA